MQVAHAGTQLDRACDHLYRHHQASLVNFACLRGCDEHEAFDAVQDLFLRLFRHGLLFSLAERPVEWQRARLLRILRWMILNQWRHKATVRRGSGAEMASLEAMLEEGQDVASSGTPASEHDRSWAMSVVDRGLHRLRSSVSVAKWSSIEPALLGGLSAEMDVCRTPALRVAVHRARVRLREFVAMEAGSGCDIPAGRAALFNAVCL